jgi:tRNA modification GTPase
MQSAAREAIEQADLVVHCVPVDEVPQENPDEDRLMVRTKADLDGGQGAREPLAVSAHAGQGLDALRSAIAHRLADRAVSLAADALALSPRHETALRLAYRNLGEADDLVATSRNERALARPELVAASMRLALDDLAELSGDISPEDVLGRVFATFCVGK